MEQNHTHSPEASTDELASPSTPVLSEVEGLNATTQEQPRFTPSLVSPSLNETFADTERHARRCRHDGWTPERIVRFLESLAACGVVADACKTVGLSAQSAYAFRNRRAGRAFGTAWDAVLIHRARGRLSDELMSRAINGCVEAVHNRNGSIVGEKHRYDNRLSMAVLTRLDRLAEKQGEREDQLRAVSEDLDDLLDVVEAGGDADAFVDARKPAPPSAPPPRDRTEVVEDEWDRMAKLLGCFDYKAMEPAEIDLSDLPGSNVDDWDVEQDLRAHYSGYSTWLAILERQRDAADSAGREPRARDDSPQAYMTLLRARRRSFLKAKAVAAKRADTEGAGDGGAAPDAGQSSTSSTYCAASGDEGIRGVRLTDTSRAFRGQV